MVLLSGDGKGIGEGRSPNQGKHLQPPPFGQGPSSVGPVGAEGAAGPEGNPGGDDDGAAATVPVPGVGQAPKEGEGGEDEDPDSEYEDLEDFSELPDTCSIASDDSFYPPRIDNGDEDDWSLGESETSVSPEPLSFFRACCTNNVVVLKTLIRQGLEEVSVQETDRNKRVRKGGFSLIPTHGGAGKG
ncbi:hypothetical protein JD844_016927 [Phrynosoma platyrhinos]|uniref:Uncharacterized protein n=1 Tax=Phrynosoma platyrhinos TaxID=52577 RepID=A0ABQ7SL25_PHRPL|nr:hypothetical protein JD844_016927 [Phrynosoma platyrhinos]